MKYNILQACRRHLNLSNVYTPQIRSKSLLAAIAPEKVSRYLLEMFDQFYEIIKARKSIRKFKSTPIPKEKLDRILEAAMHAPSGKNLQNWRFYVLQGKKRDDYLKLSQKSWLGIKDNLEKKLKPSLLQFTERFFFTLGDAPVVIICYSLNDPQERYHTSIGSVYMAVENMNLAAVAEGLGSCTMGAPLEIRTEVDEFLGVTELQEYKEKKLELLCALVLGYPDHEPPKAPRQIEGRVKYLS